MTQTLPASIPAHNTLATWTRFEHVVPEGAMDFLISECYCERCLLAAGLAGENDTYGPSPMLLLPRI